MEHILVVAQPFITLPRFNYACSHIEWRDTTSISWQRAVGPNYGSLRKWQAQDQMIPGNKAYTLPYQIKWTSWWYDHQWALSTRCKQPKEQKKKKRKKKKKKKNGMETISIIIKTQEESEPVIAPEEDNNKYWHFKWRSIWYLMVFQKYSYPYTGQVIHPTITHPIRKCDVWLTCCVKSDPKPRDLFNTPNKRMEEQVRSSRVKLQKKLWDFG